MNANKTYCLSSPMDEHKTESLWSECFQDLGSWCHQPQDELNTPNVINQNEYNFSFDDQSMYYQWDTNSSSVDLKGEMWKTQADTDLSSLQFPSEEDNNNSLMQTMVDEGTRGTGIRYSGNLLLTQCPPYNIDKSMDRCHTKTLEWANTSQKNHIETPQQNATTSQNTLLAERQNNIVKNSPPKEELTLNKTKPSLKLNIAAASKASASVDIAAPFSMNTPDVFKSLSDDSDFNLISFVCSGPFGEPNLLAEDPSIISQKPKESPTVSEQVIKIDHDYAETKPSEDLRYHTLISMKKDNDVIQIKEEADKFFPIAVKDEPSSPGPGLSLGKRVRKSVAEHSEDFIFDDDPSSDNSSEWLPFVKKKSKTSKSKNDGVKIAKRSRTSSVSDCSVCDSSSITSGPDRYRELRDKNNEASRRSRMNRKQREVEMLDRAESLQNNNQKLRERAASLEKRVKALRGILLKVVLEKNKKNI